MLHFLPQTPSSLPLPFPLLLLLLVSISGFIIPSCAQRYLNCSGPNTAPLHPNLNSDVNSLLSSLSSKAASHSFYNESFNGIHGLFLCRGDVPNEVCRTCVESASQQMKVDCSSRTNGTLCFDECMVRYSVENIFGTLETVPRILLYDSKNKSTLEARNSIDLSLVYNLIRDATEADLMFKAGLVNVSGSENLKYGLAQCTRDITRRACDVCLKNLVDFGKGCCLRQKGWRVIAPNCNLRVEAYRFYDIPGALPPSLPAPDEDGEGPTFFKVVLQV